ncbi:MAG: hypothetical protein M4579_001290 [Chaenotheca gracillima]|nr:MAG: hypothetical protein M4579_001290 [Chaenotheca gracillima]
MPSHAESCPFARLSPLIDSHSSRIRTLETENAILRRKLEAFTSPTLAPMMPNNLPPLNDPGDPSSSDNHQLSTATTNDESQSIELQTHLITSYESLRSDIDRLSVSMSDLDARQSVLVMNESLRVKDDFAHLNAVVGSMRVQLHWLMSNRLQNQQRQQQVTRSPASATAVAVAGSSTAANTGATGSNTRSTTAPGPNDMAAGPRRLSETSRQETKL